MSSVRIVVNKGEIYNDFEIIKEEPTKNKQRMFLCRCKCGNIRSVSLMHLRDGHSKSCGCRRFLPINRKKPFGWCYNLIKTSKHFLSLTYDDYLEFTKLKTCHYCNCSINWQPHRERHNQLQKGHNIDRKDCKIGYTKENCVVCCPRCNWSKQDCFTYEEFLKIGAVIKTFGGN
jgi:hypothetical protein